MSFNVVVPSHVDRCYVDNCPTIVDNPGDFCEDHKNFTNKCVSCGEITWKTCTHRIANGFETCNQSICENCTHTDYPNLKRIKTHDKKENLKNAEILFRTIEGTPVRYGDKVYEIEKTHFGMTRVAYHWSLGCHKFTQNAYFSNKKNAKKYQIEHLVPCEYCNELHIINNNQHNNLTVGRICNISWEEMKKIKFG